MTALRTILRSKLGVALAAANTLVLLLAFAQLPNVGRTAMNAPGKAAYAADVPGDEFIAGRSYHLDDVPPVFTVISVLETPGIIAVGLGRLLLAGLFRRLSPYEASWLLALLYLIATSFQWWLAGAGAEALVRALPRSRRAA